MSFSNDDADAKAITITQIIDSTGKIQVQTTQKHPVKVFSDTGIITHHSNRVSSETIEVEYNDYLEDATFTYHTGGQLIISNLIEGMKVEHYAKPPIQNIVNGVVESFIILKPEDKIVFLNREQNKLEQFLNNLLSVSNFQSNQDLSLQEEASINPELKLTLFRGKYGGIKNGQVIILFMISHAHGYFSEGLAPVMFNNKWGYVNTQGEMFIACQFESAGDFSEGLAPVMLNNKWGYVNTQGIIVIPCQFEDVKEFSEELAPVRLNDKWGYVNTQGEIFISCKFE
ncbi:WG repeat-containing protein, partial [Crocosphaera watsonii]